MTVRNPVRIDLLKRAIRTAFVNALGPDVPAGQIVWLERNLPRPERPLIGMQWLSLPASTGFEQEVYRQEIDSVAIAVTSADAGQRYRIIANGAPYDFTASGAPTIVEIRDGLRDLLNNVTTPVTKQTEPILAVDGGTDADITVTPTETGGILLIETPTGTPVTITPTLNATVCVMHTLKRVQGTIAVNVWTEGGVATELGGATYAQRMRSSLVLQSTQDLFRSFGVAARPITGITDVSALAGANFESHMQFDIMCGTTSRAWEVLEPIEAFDLELNIGDVTTTDTVTIG